MPDVFHCSPVGNPVDPRDLTLDIQFFGRRGCDEKQNVTVCVTLILVLFVVHIARQWWVGARRVPNFLVS